MEASPLWTMCCKAADSARPPDPPGPLMIVAGDHVVNDMAGDGEDSWNPLWSGPDILSPATVKGLGEYPQVRQMFLAHLAKALECLKR